MTDAALQGVGVLVTRPRAQAAERRNGAIRASANHEGSEGRERA